MESKKGIEANFFILLLLLIFALVIGLIIGSGILKRQPSPNEKLIEYLQEQRRITDSSAAARQLRLDSLLAQTFRQHTQDSIEYASRQQQLLQSIKNIKSKYAQIPDYADLSKDSLRRSISAALGQ